MTSVRVGFIGLGDQGAPMADRILAAGMPLTVWARRPEVREAYVAKGAAAASSVAELGAVSDHVGICVVNDADVFSVTDQLIPAMAPGSRIAIHATVLPETVVELGRQCDARGIHLIDAPVSGMRAGAVAGTLTVMCGATQHAFDAALPVFQTFGKAIVLLGPVGSGQRAKVVVNAMAGAHLGIAMASLEVAAALGLERGPFVELATQSGGRSFAFEVFARLPSPTDFKHNAALLIKDMKLLSAVLPDDPNVSIFTKAADQFLRAATTPAASHAA
jgi:3-hydroxyisobutyrate dehydrogenase